MGHVDHFGPSADLVDQNRRRLITRILIALRTYEETNGFCHGAHTFPSATWFSLWLSDLCRLEKTATDFENDANLAWGQNNKVDSFRLVTMWLPKSGIAPKLPSIHEPSCFTPNVLSTSPRAPNTPTTNQIAQLSVGLVGTSMESSPPQEETPTISPVCKRRKIADSSSGPGTPSDVFISGNSYLNRGYVCAISKNTYPLEAAHIFPPSLSKHRHSSAEMFADFISDLSLFWSREQVEKWLGSVAKLAETTANAIALHPAVHSYWDKALFALRFMSVNNEKTEMKLRFYWLKPVLPLAHGSTILLPEHITDDYMIDPPLLADGLEAGGRDHDEDVPEAISMILNCQTRKFVRSGDEITITTPDPIHLPLPDEELLRLQWNIHRLAALCAAAGFFADSFYEDDDFVTLLQALHAS